MKTLGQHLSELPAPVLQAIARQQGIVLTSEVRADIVAMLAQIMTNPEHLAQVWQELESKDRAVIEALAAAEGRLPAGVFQRQFGEVRRFGPGRLQHERPWLNPSGPAERLWYAGLITRGFIETENGLADFFAIPTDLLPLLPHSTKTPTTLTLTPVTPPERTRSTGDQFLQDLATLLMFVQNEEVWPDAEGQWSRRDMQRLCAQWITPPSALIYPPAPGSRPALVFFCAQTLGFMVIREKRLHLAAPEVRPWLESTRFQQARALFSAWRHAPGWNDLCYTPGLICEPGNWRNDPVAARRALLDHLRSLHPNEWYALDAFITAIYHTHPDFQRPDGNYDSWYIRDEQGVFLKGFEHWHEVEGRLLRYLWTGPLHWLGIIALDEAEQCWSLTTAGTALLAGVEPPHAEDAPPLVITDDFCIHLPTGVDVRQRFRVARFCQWEASWPGFRYRITQRALHRAAGAGITAAHILDYLETASVGMIPGNVRDALVRFQS